jgi:hypothetical protein
MDSTKLKANVQKALDKIGNDKLTGIPEIGDNLPQEPLAWELMLSGIIRSYGEKRYDVAKKKAEEGKILGNDTPEPGTKAVVYDGAYVSIIRTVNNAPQKVDMTKFQSALRKLGVSAAVIEKALLEATTAGTAAKRYEAVPK